ncbi:hypothetical protein [Lederbergia lenta]|nr:hypothetical protein [Lederbergia lenta]MEC2326365.1 hypothetical protein [Lederbergia lenta]
MIDWNYFSGAMAMTSSPFSSVTYVFASFKTVTIGIDEQVATFY